MLVCSLRLWPSDFSTFEFLKILQKKVSKNNIFCIIEKKAKKEKFLKSRWIKLSGWKVENFFKLPVILPWMSRDATSFVFLRSPGYFRAKFFFFSVLNEFNRINLRLERRKQILAFIIFFLFFFLSPSLSLTCLYFSALSKCLSLSFSLFDFLSFLLFCFPPSTFMQNLLLEMSSNKRVKDKRFSIRMKSFQ